MDRRQKQKNRSASAAKRFVLVAGTDPALNLSGMSDGAVLPTEIRPGLDLLFNAYDITDARKSRKKLKSAGI